MSAPRSPHLGAANRILCYLKSTIWFGLSFRQSPSPFALCGFSNFDWAGYLDTCRSTIGTTWISHLLHELELPSSGPTILLCDNLSTTYMASNPLANILTKGLSTYYFHPPSFKSRLFHIIGFVGEC
ncbi:unnamed protein product [Prunus armeniaca]